MDMPVFSLKLRDMKHVNCGDGGKSKLITCTNNNIF
jgi:hypothetical protein